MFEFLYVLFGSTLKIFNLASIEIIWLFFVFYLILFYYLKIFWFIWFGSNGHNNHVTCIKKHMILFAFSIECFRPYRHSGDTYAWITWALGGILSACQQRIEVFLSAFHQPIGPLSGLTRWTSPQMAHVPFPSTMLGRGQAPLVRCHLRFFFLFWTFFVK